MHTWAIDWVSMTIHNKDNADEMLSELGAYQDTSIFTQPLTGYTHTIKFGSGLLYAWHETLTTQGQGFVFNGSTLREFTSRGISPLEIIRMGHRLNGKASRLDIAFDFYDYRVSQNDFDEGSIIWPKGRGRRPEVFPVGREGKNWGLYIGSPTSDYQINAYQKGWEQQQPERDWARFEMRLKKKKAAATFAQMGQVDDKQCLSIAQARILSVVDYAHAWWREALYGESVQLSEAEGAEKNTLKWLKRTAAPSLAREQILHPGKNPVQAFCDAVNERLASSGLSLRMQVVESAAEPTDT